MRTIIEMVQLTRLDCAIASAGSCAWRWRRRCIMRATAACSRKRLADQPMMRAVLADLALEVEGATALVMRLCRARSISPARSARGGARGCSPRRSNTGCARPRPAFIYEAMECLGGNGYVEESVLPRLYREAPVNAIWEGSGNVMCLDVLRALGRDGEAARAVSARSPMRPPTYRGAAAARVSIETALASPDAEVGARAGVGCLALLAAAAALR